jgi:hypothetical protein
MTKPSHMGGGRVDVDGLAYPLHWPMVRSCQPKGHGIPTR